MYCYANKCVVKTDVLRKSYKTSGGWGFGGILVDLSMKKLILFFVLASYSCQGEQTVNIQDPILELEALRQNNNFSTPFRVLETTISDASVFDEPYGKTEQTIGYVLRYYFFTTIRLKRDSNRLTSMDGSKFNIQSSNDALEVAKSTIDVIASMSFGSEENRKFIDKYFSGCIDYTKVPNPCASTKEYQPVCGCDGFTYNNRGEAYCAGVQSVSDSACQ